MSSKKKSKKESSKNDNLDYIKKVVDNNVIGKREIEYFASLNYPIFSFKYLQEYSIKDCKDTSFYKDFLFRLKKLSELGWDEIRKSERHSFGMEKIPYFKIKPKAQLPDFITPDAEFCAFRATGANLPFIGIQNGRIFHIIFVETKFGDIYDH